MGNTWDCIKCNRAILCYPKMVAPRYTMSCRLRSKRSERLYARFDSVWFDVGKRLLGQFARVVRLAAPSPEAASHAVRRPAQAQVMA